jgi:putative phosphoesterase
VLEELRALGPVEAVHGNVDEPALRQALPERLVVDAQGLRIGLVHDGGPAAGRDERLLARFPGCGLIVYGHTHRPRVDRVRESWIVNPGSPTERRLASAHTMAVVQTGRPELVQLD